MDSCTLETLAPKLNCPGGLTFCHEKSIFGILGPTVQGSKILPWKKYTWTPDKLGSWAQLSGSPNMCLDKWTVVPPETLAPGPKCPGAQLSALKKGTVVPPRNFSSGAQLSGGAQISVLEKKRGQFYPGHFSSKYVPWKMDSCSLRQIGLRGQLYPGNFSSGAQLSRGPTFCLEKTDSCTLETFAPGPNCPGAKLSALKKRTVVPRKL